MNIHELLNQKPLQSQKLHMIDDRLHDNKFFNYMIYEKPKVLITKFKRYKK